MDKRPSALFYIPSLEAGGAERVCLLYVNSLKSFRPNLALQFIRGDLLDELRSEVPLLDLSSRYKSRGRRSFRPFKKLRKRIRRKLRTCRRKLSLLLKSFLPTKKLRKKIRRKLLAYKRILLINVRIYKLQLLLLLKQYLPNIERMLVRVKPTPPRWCKPFELIGGFILQLLKLPLIIVLKPLRSITGKWAGLWSNSRLRTRLIRFKGQVDEHLEWLHLPSRCWFLLKQARRLAGSARKRRCDLVVSFLPYTNAIAVLAKVIFNCRLKVVLNVHSIKSRLLK